MTSVGITVLGRVQGVWFRASTERKARGLDITGFVCNQSDGSVYIEAHGSESAIRAFIAWCHNGPPHASVTNVEVSPIESSSSDAFVIKR